VNWDRRDLLGLEQLTKDEIIFILDTADSFKEISTRAIKKVPTLRGKTVVLLFLEPSTRTRVSFELAAKRLSADMVNISSSTSSMLKGESLRDTIRNIEAMKVDLVVVRHSMAGAPHWLAGEIEPGVINAGDGCHEHPTQALLDMFTIREKKGKLKGLKVAIIGDISHSRVARSNMWGLIKVGAEVVIAGPPTYIPPYIEKMGVEVRYSVEEAIKGADVVMVLRIQRERQGKNLLPSLREYRKIFGINRERLKVARPDALVMHPGPVNRGIELDPDVADGPQSVILEQVTSGVAIRMAVMYILLGVKG
jgi:aspartate carbamoyltransferase catalytic subunit